jgi:DNA-binding GntR family transcriptional regulator
MRGFPSLDSSERVIRDALIRCDDANARFHDAVHVAADNARLQRVIREVHPTFPRSLMILPLVQEEALVDENLRQHRAILEALQRRDAEAARAAMLAHVEWAGDLVARWFESQSAAPR